MDTKEEKSWGAKRAGRGGAGPPRKKTAGMDFQAQGLVCIRVNSWLDFGRGVRRHKTNHEWTRIDTKALFVMRTGHQRIGVGSAFTDPWPSTIGAMGHSVFGEDLEPFIHEAGMKPQAVAPRSGACT